MSMSKNEKDEFIRKALIEDKVMASGEEVKKKVKKEIGVSKIKQKKYTYGERLFMKFLAVVLVVSLGANAYLINTKTNLIDNIAPQNEEIDNLQSVYVEDNIEENNEYLEEDVNENTITENMTVENDILSNNTNTITVQPPIVEVEHTNVKETELDEDLLKSELESYAITVGRYDDADDLEKNTMILLVANDFFNNKVTKSTGLDISSNNKYAMTAKNVHLFIKELTGIQVENHLDSYINYMKYNDNSKFYSSGEDSTKLKDEKYEISNLSVMSSENNQYEIEGNLHRKSMIEKADRTKTWKEEIEADYSLKATVVVNVDYTYIPYLIKEFNAELKPGQEDNINRLVSIDEQNTNNTKRK